MSNPSCMDPNRRLSNEVTLDLWEQSQGSIIYDRMVGEIHAVADKGNEWCDVGYYNVNTDKCTLYSASYGTYTERKLHELLYAIKCQYLWDPAWYGNKGWTGDKKQ